MGGQQSTRARSQPLTELGEHQLWHMSAFDNEEVGRMYAATARRGNPVLSNATDEALFIRGQEMAAAARSNPCSFVCTDFHGTPAACFFSWDATEEPAFTQDPSLSVHRALHGLVFQERAKRIRNARKGEVLHCAYGGCMPGEPALLLLLMQHVCVRTGYWAGFKQMYGCAVNPVTVRGTAQQPKAWMWEVPFEEVVMSDGSRPLAGKAPYRAVASLQPMWVLGGLSHLVPQAALPYVSAQRQKQDAARRRRRVQRASETVEAVPERTEDVLEAEERKAGAEASATSTATGMSFSNSGASPQLAMKPKL